MQETPKSPCDSPYLLELGNKSMHVSFNERSFTLRRRNGAVETYLESVLWRTVRKPTSYVNTLHLKFRG